MAEHRWRYIGRPRYRLAYGRGEMEERICPLVSKPEGKDSGLCKRHKCQWWTDHYTIENQPVQDCALVILAKKNEAGLVWV